jgi:hypothetical protein
MLVQVIYQDDKRCGAVHRSRLDFLIRSGLLFAFRRAEGWVIVEKDPIRGSGGSYTGPERRRSENFFDCTTLGDTIEEGQVWPTSSGQDLSELEYMKVLESYCNK